MILPGKDAFCRRRPALRLAGAIPDRLEMIKSYPIKLFENKKASLTARFHFLACLSWPRDSRRRG